MFDERIVIKQVDDERYLVGDKVTQANNAAGALGSVRERPGWAGIDEDLKVGQVDPHSLSHDKERFDLPSPAIGEHLLFVGVSFVMKNADRTKPSVFCFFREEIRVVRIHAGHDRASSLNLWCLKKINHRLVACFYLHEFLSLLWRELGFTVGIYVGIAHRDIGLKDHCVRGRELTLADSLCGGDLKQRFAKVVAHLF